MGRKDGENRPSTEQLAFSEIDTAYRLAREIAETERHGERVSVPQGHYTADGDSEFRVTHALYASRERTPEVEERLRRVTTNIFGPNTAAEILGGSPEIMRKLNDRPPRNLLYFKKIEPKAVVVFPIHPTFTQ